MFLHAGQAQGRMDIYSRSIRVARQRRSICGLRLWPPFPKSRGVLAALRVCVYGSLFTVGIVAKKTRAYMSIDVTLNPGRVSRYIIQEGGECIDLGLHLTPIHLLFGGRGS